MEDLIERGIYLTVMDWHFVILQFEICKYKREDETHEWWHPGNPIDIARKYHKHPSKWTKLPEITDRWSKEPPLDGQICVVHLISNKIQRFIKILI
jgi:hypothetical protein